MNYMRMLLLLSLSVGVLTSCERNSHDSENLYRIAVVSYQHETCTFCPGGDTEIADWTVEKPYIEDDELLRSGSYIRGFVTASERFGDVELIGIKSPHKVFGGSSRSWNSKASFDHFMDLILQDIQANMPLDAVYLALHGAMAVRDVPRPEAEIAKRIRELVGAEIPIVATLDLHGNEDEEFLKWADGSFVTKRYPHYDSYLQGERAAHYTRQMLRGDYSPTTTSIKVPILTASVLQWTGQYPSMNIMERARRWEARVPDAYVSVFYGFPWADTPDGGMLVQVMTNDNQKMADSIAQDMYNYIWSVREDFAKGDYLMPDEAVFQTNSSIKSGLKPVVLGDYSDRPGDATWILDELIKQSTAKVLYAALTDAPALKHLQESEAKVGDPFDREVGGYTGEQAGKPVRVSGKLSYVGPLLGYDYVAVVDFGRQSKLVIAPTYTQITTTNPLRNEAFNVDDFDVIVLKSRVHFRRGFDETGYAKSIFIVDAPGSWFGTTRLQALDFKFLPIAEMYPFSNKSD